MKRLAIGPRQTVKQHLEQWLEDVYKHEVRVSTYIRRRILIYKHIIPELGYLQLKTLTPQQVQAFYARKLREGLSPGYVGTMHDVLSKAIKQAVRWRLISFNIMEDVTEPKPGEHEVPILTRDQARELLKTAQEHGLHAFVLLDRKSVV